MIDLTTRSAMEASSPQQHRLEAAAPNELLLALPVQGAAALPGHPTDSFHARCNLMRRKDLGTWVSLVRTRTPAIHCCLLTSASGTLRLCLPAVAHTALATLVL